MKNKITLLLAVFLFCLAQQGWAQIITTIAGDSTAGYNGDNIPAVDAALNNPTFVALDGFGNVYISDFQNCRIRKINTAGIISTIAGTDMGGYSGDGGPATNAKISGPTGLKFDTYGNLYFADDGNACVRKIDTAGIITTIAGIAGHRAFSGDGGPATAAELNSPHDVAIDASGNVYITDFENSCVRVVNTAGIINTFAGIGEMSGSSGDGGAATTAKLHFPYGITLDYSGNIYVADYGNNNIREINTENIISTIAGIGSAGFSGDAGPATLAQLFGPAGIAVDANNNFYFGDALNSRVREINSSGEIFTVAGNPSAPVIDNVPATGSGMLPIGVAVDDKGSLYIADFGDNRIRYVKNTLLVNNIYNIHKNFILYPNPCNGSFNINITTDIEEQAILTITNVQAQKIRVITINTNEEQEVQLDVPPGIYFITVATTEGTVCKEIEVTNKCC